MSYALKAPEITGFKVDLPEKGMHLVIDANMKGGELDVNEGLADFGGESAKAWIMNATQDFKITKVQITLDEFAKLKSKDAGAKTSTENPYAFLDTVSESSIAINAFGGTVNVPITDGKINLDDTLDSLGEVMATSVNGLVNIAAGSDADVFFRWINDYRGHLDPWQQTFVDNYMAEGGDAIGTLIQDLIAQGNAESVNNIWTLILTLFGGDVLKSRELVEDEPGNYDATTQLLLLSKTILYQQKHPQVQTDAEIAAEHTALLTAQGIDQVEYDRIIALPFDRINSIEDLVGEMSEVGVMWYPDADGIKPLLTVWLTDHFATYLSESLNFSFGADIKHLNAEKLSSEVTYSSEEAKAEGISISIGPTSTPKFIDLKSLSIPAIRWINKNKSTKIAFDSLKMSSNGFKLDNDSKTKAFKGDLIDGNISGLNVSFKK